MPCDTADHRRVPEIRRRVTAVETDQGDDRVPDGGVVVLALGTIESAPTGAACRCPACPATRRIGANLMAHLRSNLTIRIPRAAIAGLPGGGERTAGVGAVRQGPSRPRRRAVRPLPSADHRRRPRRSQAPTRKRSSSRRFPTSTRIDRFKPSPTRQIVITMRGIGEMRPANANTRVTLSGELDEFRTAPRFRRHQARAATTWICGMRWTGVRRRGAASLPTACLTRCSLGSRVPARRGRPIGVDTVLPFVNSPRRDGLGTTHHEAGTLAMGDDPATSVTNADTASTTCPTSTPSARRCSRLSARRTRC